MRLIALLSLLVITCSCASKIPFVTENGVDLLKEPVVYTLVTLHPDERQAWLYTSNYQQRGFIPMCSAVDLISLTENKLKFKVAGREKTYIYHYQKTEVETFEKHLSKIFGVECNKSDVEQLSEIDQYGIRIGRIAIGMSKKGVVYAIGYPPTHVTPTLEANEWIYWNSRFNKMKVVFDEDGLVIEIKE